MKIYEIEKMEIDVGKGLGFEATVVKVYATVTVHANNTFFDVIVTRDGDDFWDVPRLSIYGHYGLQRKETEIQELLVALDIPNEIDKDAKFLPCGWIHSDAEKLANVLIEAVDSQRWKDAHV